MSSAQLQSIQRPILKIFAIIFFSALVLGAWLINPHNELAGRQNAPLPMPGLGKRLCFNWNSLAMRTICAPY